MQAHVFRRLISVVTGVFLAAVMGLASGTVVAVVSHPHAAHASTVGGQISRTEVLSRAQWWMNTYGVIYSQNQANAKLDPDGAHRYRPDCSGFVSMAWHLPKKSDGWDRNTNDLAGFGDTTWLGSLGDLLPGDAILGVSYGHVALFERWANSAKTQMWIYDEFSTGDEGRHAIKDRSWYQANGFRRLFPGAGTHVGTAWGSSNVERIVTGDFNGDRKTDIAAQYVNGQMRAWASTGDLSADMRLFPGAGTLVGAGWNSGNVQRIVTGDFNADNKTDIIAQYMTGEMRAWASTGDLSADMRLFPGAGAHVGTAWGSSNVERIV